MERKQESTVQRMYSSYCISPISATISAAIEQAIRRRMNK